ncbi:metal-dependent transcriptional regulator [Corynebacterium caspium]|uniref:metal-dependent transcriptional regulator n=1 Tax=Corynebacterium caspium TaxID=234828 RepID=UPI0003799A7C|nr:metal-dependent transcriptional regulator [Corynebacterium caspium]WKD58793.1 Iron-dependent repressor IdeR [Corynebacterium caspium DSM 44850]
MNSNDHGFSRMSQPDVPDNPPVLADSQTDTATSAGRVDYLSPTAQDYLKAIWSATEWGGPPLGSKKLADRFGSSTANATETVKRLANQGLLEYQAYQPVRLTEKGRALAVEMVRRHRLLETFLMTMLDYTWDEVHEEAERLEHAVTPRLMERIDALLGHPSTDPHGDPIPAPDGTMPDTSLAFALCDAPVSKPLEVLRIDDANTENLHQAEELGIFPGIGIQRVFGTKELVLIDETECEINLALAQAVWVRLIDE